MFGRGGWGHPAKAWDERGEGVLRSRERKGGGIGAKSSGNHLGERKVGIKWNAISPVKKKPVEVDISRLVWVEEGGPGKLVEVEE